MVRPCPRCAGWRVRLASNPLKHCARLLLGTKRRHCPDCGFRWIDRDAVEKPNYRALAVIGALILAWPAIGLTRRAIKIRGEARARAERLNTLAAGQGSRASAPQAPAAPDLVDAFWQAWDEARQDAAAQSQAAAARPAGGFAGTDRGSNGGDLAAMIRLLLSSRSESELGAVDRMSKRELWDQYGKHFSSKQEAQEAYDEYKKQRKARAP